jgi:hypothetical protein
MEEQLRNHQTRKMVRGGVVPMAALAEMVLVEIGVSGPSYNVVSYARLYSLVASLTVMYSQEVVYS